MEPSTRLVVKTPNQRFKDIHIDCDLGWTVKKLKEYLADVHPTNPETVSQKIIYSGHLLKDEQQLKEVLNKDRDSHTLHIVCPSASEENLKEKESMSQSAPQTEDQPAASSLPSHDGLRHRNAPNITQQASVSDHDQWSAYSNQYTAYWRNYYETLQRSFQPDSQMQNQLLMGASTANNLYQWQLNMMAMYQQHMPGSYPFLNPTTLPPSPVTPQAVPATPNFEPLQHGAALEDQPAAAQPQVNVPGQREPVANNEQRNGNVPMNAGGAMFDDDDENGEGRRDWLDWVHTFLRASVMISIMYFYSSTVRILMISLLGFIVYLYQAGWLNWRRPREEQEANDDQNPPNQNETDGQPAEEDAIREDQDTNELINGTDENDFNVPQENMQPPEMSPFRAQMNLIYVFVTSFFTSLVPQRAQ